MKYTPFNWYWSAQNKSGVVFSSGQAAWVSTTDAIYEAWLAAGNTATIILSDGELADVLTKAGAPAATIYACGVTSFGNVPPDDILTLMLAMGLSITSTSTASLSGIYPIDANSQQKITSEAVNIQVTGASGTAKFTNGQTTRAWLDVKGAQHTFNTTQFISFAETIGTYVDSLETSYATALAGGSPNWPTPSATMP